MKKPPSSLRTLVKNAEGLLEGVNGGADMEVLQQLTAIQAAMTEILRKQLGKKWESGEGESEYDPLLARINAVIRPRMEEVVRPAFRPKRGEGVRTDKRNPRILAKVTLSVDQFVEAHRRAHQNIVSPGMRGGGIRSVRQNLYEMWVGAPNALLRELARRRSAKKEHGGEEHAYLAYRSFRQECEERLKHEENWFGAVPSLD